MLAEQNYESRWPGVVWPALGIDISAILMAWLAQHQLIERLSTEAIRLGQFKQLVVLATHLEKHSAQFAQRLASAGLNPEDLASQNGLSALPPLLRSSIQEAQGQFFSTEVPVRHEPIYETRTSGSTGVPVTIRRTELNRIDWLGMTMRDHLWHRRDFSGRLCSVRAHFESSALAMSWGPPASELFTTGQALILPGKMDAELLARQIKDFDPHYVLGYPSIFAAIARHLERIGRNKNLQSIRTIGEMLSGGMRAYLCAEFGVKVVDSYSSEEVGVIAIQCPDSDLYHVCAETILLEIVDDDGKPCAEGEMGHVLVTDLHNYASPLIRYDIGDMAIVGGQCACGRGLPTLSQITGRKRNLIRYPDGSLRWPRTGYRRFMKFPSIRQFQFAQVALDTIEVRLVVNMALTAFEENEIRAIILEALGYPFELRFVYLSDWIARSARGKYEEFICLIDN